jgi:hypothetical protein
VKIPRIIVKPLALIASAWARYHEKAILREGVSLDPQQIEDARRVGVQHPELVRTLKVETVPPRLHPLLHRLASRFGAAPGATAGMALGYGIFLRADCSRDRALLLHELVHTAQYERLGFRRFMEEYLHECLTCGYPLGDLEQEAHRVSAECLRS